MHERTNTIERVQVMDYVESREEGETVALQYHE